MKKTWKQVAAAIMAVVMVISTFVGIPVSTVQAATATELQEGKKYVIVSKATGMAMTVSGFSTGNNATIVQWPVENYKSQVWTLDSDNNGYYQIVNEHSGKSFNIPWASTDEGVTIVQFNKENSNNSKWQITDAGNGYCRITPYMSATYGLNVENASANRGAEIIQGTFTGADNELWEFREIADANIQNNPDISKVEVDARLAIDSYIDKFFYVEDGLGKLRNMPSNGFWTDAEVLEMFIDAYEHLGDKKYLTVAEQFYDGIIDRRGTSWEWNDYNDDVMWMVIASIRLYEHTNNEKHLNAARENFDMCYNRAWDDTLGGGLWWRTDNQTKNACVNSPAVIAAAKIAKQLEENNNSAADGYWDKAKAIWDWEYDVLYYPETVDGHAAGEIMDNMKKDGTPIHWANTGNQGVFAGATILLYEKYGDNSGKGQTYTQVANLACDLAATMGDGAEGYLNRESNSGDSIGGKGLLGRWLGYYTDVCENVDEYDDWMMINAQAAWFNRNSDNLMWGAFGRPTIENVEECDEVFQPDNQNVTMKNYASWGCHSAVAWILNCTKLTPSEQAIQNSWEVKSLDNNTSMTLRLTDSGSLVYSVKQGDVTIVEESPLGINTSVGDFTTGLTYETEVMNSVNETYNVLSGKKSVYTNKARGREFVFKKDNVEFSVIVRAYNDGVAFRYAINTGKEENFTIAPNSEITGIKVPAASQMWYMPYENDFMYERDYVSSSINDMATGTQPSMPMLYNTNGKYVLVTEAEKTGSYVGSILQLEDGRLLRTKFDPDQKNNVTTSAPFASPWRAFVIGSEETIINNTMVENLSPAPSDDYNFEKWVEPGVSSWSWVSYYGGQEDPEVHKEFIDLASKMGWKYYILDEKWQPKSTTGGSRYEGMWDWFTEVRDYANDKGVELIAWVDKSDVDTDAEREARFKEWSEAGIVGIKVDFFYDETQKMLQLHDDIYADAAKYHLLVNVHGSNPPSGEIRTYPNVIAREAIKGQEQGGITANQYTIIPFIRAAVGTADVTEQLNSRDTSKTTKGFQIALSTLVENGIRSLGSKPDEYFSDAAAVGYYKNFPAKWDDTKLLSSSVGEYVNIARKSGDNWYAAGISVAAQDMKWKPSFLKSGKKYTAFIYKEKAADGDRQSLTTEIKKDVTADTELSIHVQAGGGYAVKLIPQDETLQSITVFPSTLKVQVHKTKQVEVSMLPESLNVTDVTWEVKDDNIAKITPTGTGVTIKGAKPGTTTVTATSVFDPSKKATVQVEVTQSQYSLDTSKWTVINDNSKYEVTGENTVTIEAENGVIQNNVFGYKIPSGVQNWEIEAKVSGNLFANYQGGFVGAFNGTSLANNFVGAGRRYHEYVGIDGDNAFGMMSGQNTEFYTKDTKEAEDAYIRLVKEGNNFTGYYRFSENEAWTQIINGDNNAITRDNLTNNDNLYVGFFSGTGGTFNNINVTFENFKYNGQLIKLATKNENVSTKENFTVEFDSAGGSNVNAQIIEAGQKATKPADPTRTNYTFMGWYVDGKQYDFNTAVNKDVKLIAKWKTSKKLTLTTLEAETATLKGANRATNENASGGYHVGSIGGDNNATVTFDVATETDGMRTMKIYYCTLNARNFSVSVNGEEVDSRSYPGTGNWTTICANPIEMEIELKAGNNTIQFAGVDGGDAPNLDRIQLELTDLEAGAGGALENVEVSAVTLEAEVGAGDGYTSYAINAENDNASNGAYRGGLGGQMYGAITFNVDADATSVRNLKVYYCAGETRELGVVVNGTEVAALECAATGGWGTACTNPVETAIVLQEGANEIQFTGVNGEFAPNLDKIVIELTKDEADAIIIDLIDNLPANLSVASSDEDKTKVTAVAVAYNSLKDKSGITNSDELDAALKAIGEAGLDGSTTDPGTGGGGETPEPVVDTKEYELEGEAGTLGGGAVRVMNLEDASNNCHVGNIGGNGNGTLTFNVNAEAAGKRALKVYHTTWGTRQMNVVVNGTVAATLTCTGDSWNTPNATAVATEINLVKGENTIQFTGVNGDDGTNIDKIVIALTSSETTDIVNDMIGDLPDEVTENDKVVVYAVKTAYDQLSADEKQNITNVAKLNNAVAQADALGNEGEGGEEGGDDGNNTPAPTPLVVTDFEMEAETGEINGNADIVPGAQGCSNECYVGNIGTGTITFTVNAEAEGERTMKVYYSTLNQRQLSITVNGTTLDPLTCPGTGGWGTRSVNPVEVTVTLQEGENTIVLGGVDGAYAPNLDSVVLQLTNKEATDIVNTLIEKVPNNVTAETVSDDDKAFINAVDKAYNNLDDKTDVANVDKLTKAVEEANKEVIVATQPLVEKIPVVAEGIYNPTSTLADYTMTGGTVTGTDGNAVAGTWEWKNKATVPTAGNNGYVAVFTPDDAERYEPVEDTITVNVKKATPYIAAAPVASEITCGNTLNASTISGGNVQYGNGQGGAGNTETIEGNFVWKDNTIKPAIADSNQTKYAVVFNPTDANNYNTVETAITLAVNCEHTGGTATCVKKAKCEICQNEYGEVDNNKHVNTEIRNQKAATETEDGYTGDTYCVDCETTIADGEVIPAIGIGHEHSYGDEWISDRTGHWHICSCGEISDKATHIPGAEATEIAAQTCTVCGYEISPKLEHVHTGGTATCISPAICTGCDEAYGSVDSNHHTGGTATCVKKAVCDDCHKEYGALDRSNHEETEVRNRKDATETEEGYTGDVCCVYCNVTVEEGRVIPVIGSECKHTGATEIRDAEEATETEEGYTGDTYCKDCGEKIAEGEVIPVIKKPGDTTPDTKEFEIEIEAAKLDGSASIVTTDNAQSGSDNCYVGNIGGTGNGTVTFNVNAETAGERTLKIYYSAAEDSQLSIKVNGTEIAVPTCTATGTTPLEITVNLVAGNNEIVLGGVEGVAAPNIDKIAFELTETEAKDVVSELINNLPGEVTEENKASYQEVVDAVNKAYGQLTDKEGVANVDKLTDAVAKAEELKKEGENKNQTPAPGINNPPTEEDTSLDNVTEQIIASKNDKDFKGSKFATLSLRVTKSTKTTNKLKWNKVKDANGYVIFASKCGKQLEKVKTITNKKTTSWKHTKLKKGTYYKYVVVAYKTVDSKQVTLSTSKMIHVPTTGGKYADIKSLKVNKTSIALRKNKTYKLKVTQVKKTNKKIKNHRKISFESSNTKIATVSSKGKIKAKKKGNCYIYVYAQNGVYKKVKVTVK